MNNEVMEFPQYRQLEGRKVYYKITSERNFVELSYIGEKKISFEINAEQYPEMLRIKDMLSFSPPYIELPADLVNEFPSEE